MRARFFFAAYSFMWMDLRVLCTPNMFPDTCVVFKMYTIGHSRKKIRKIEQIFILFYCFLFFFFVVLFSCVCVHELIVTRTIHPLLKSFYEIFFFHFIFISCYYQTTPAHTHHICTEWMYKYTSSSNVCAGGGDVKSEMKIV